MGILNWVPALATQQLRGIPFGHRRPRGERYPHRTILRQALQLKTRRQLASSLPRPAEPVTLSSTAGDFPALRVDVDGMTLYVPELGDRDDALFRRVVEQRAWPVDTLGPLVAFAHGDIMLDIGGNIGTTSLPRALFGVFRHIHAFEPEPRNFACLSRSIEENGLSHKVTAWPYAVGAERSQLPLLIGRGFGRHRIGRAGETGKEGSTLVPVIALDQWIEQEGIDQDAISFVKVDTQGFEAFVLKGATRLLEARKAVWQLEVAPRCMRSAGVAIGQLHEALDRHFTYFFDVQDPERGFQPVSAIADTILKLTRTHTDIVAFAKV